MIVKLTFSKYILHDRHCSKYFICPNSLNLLHSPLRWLLRKLKKRSNLTSQKWHRQDLISGSLVPACALNHQSILLLENVRSV